MSNVVSERALQHRAEQLLTLGNLESFEALREVGKEEARRRTRLMLARLNSEETASALMQRQADYDRGFIAGMHYIAVEVINKAERKLRGTPEPEDETDEDRWSYG